MPAEKASAAREFVFCSAADYVLGAARVCDQCFRPGMRGDFGERFDGGADGQGDINEIRVSDRIGERDGSFLNGMERESTLENFGTVKSHDAEGRELAAQGECEGAANQARAHDCYAMKGNCARHL